MKGVVVIIPKYPVEVKLPEIESASAKAIFSQSANIDLEENPKVYLQKVSDWRAAQPEGRLIIQEKMDGSNFTVFRNPQTLDLQYFNKGKLLDEKQSVFERTCDALRTRQELFRPGYIYHGEALRATRSCHIMYRRIPKFHWICYEIMIPYNTTTYRCATPEEMTEILKDTGLEQAHIFYDCVREDDKSCERLGPWDFSFL